MTAANAAIHYQPDAFDTSRAKLMGRQAAGEGFLNAFVRHGGVDRFYCCAPRQEILDEFEARVAASAGAARPCAWVPVHDLQGLSNIGCLYRPDPGVAELSWHRRFLSNRAYSLCGVTHTTASANVMDAIGALVLAPLQSWDAVICTSSVVRTTLSHVIERWSAYLDSRVGGRPKMAVQMPVIPLGVDCAAYASSPEATAARAEIRQRHGIGDDDVVALFFGRLSFHAKAHPLPMMLGLEQAAQRTGKRVHLIQAGWFPNDSIRDAFAAGARSFCPSVNQIHMDGRDRSVRVDAWRAADLFTSLSDNVQETFGLVPIEAMAAGLPVVVTDWDGYRDTIRPGVDGFCIPTRLPMAGLGGDLAWRFHAEIDNYDRYIGQVSQTTSVDIQASAEAYTALVGRPDLRRRMGEAGRARAREVFDWQVVIKAYQELWAELARRRQADSEIAPRVADQPAHPLRDDPYAVFASYPTATIGLDDPVALAPGADAAALARVRRHDLNTFASRVLAGAGDCQALLHHLETRGQCTVGSLIASFPPPKRGIVHRTIGWLAKVGLVHLPGR